MGGVIEVFVTITFLEISVIGGLVFAVSVLAGLAVISGVGAALGALANVLRRKR